MNIHERKGKRYAKEYLRVASLSLTTGRVCCVLEQDTLSAA